VADVNVKNNNGETALHVAIKGGYLEFSQLLLTHNADPTIKDKDGKTPVEFS